MLTRLKGMKVVMLNNSLSLRYQFFHKNTHNTEKYYQHGLQFWLAYSSFFIFGDAEAFQYMNCLLVWSLSFIANFIRYHSKHHLFQNLSLSPSVQKCQRKFVAYHLPLFKREIYRHYFDADFWHVQFIVQNLSNGLFLCRYVDIPLSTHDLLSLNW